MADTNGAGAVAVYGDTPKMAALLTTTAQLVELEPDRTFESGEVRRRARHLTALVHQRLAGTLEADEVDE